MRCQRTFVQRKHCRHHHRTTFWNTPSPDDNAIHLHTSHYGRSSETAATMNLATRQGLDTDQRKKTQCKKTAHLGFLPRRTESGERSRTAPCRCQCLVSTYSTGVVSCQILRAVIKFSPFIKHCIRRQVSRKKDTRIGLKPLVTRVFYLPCCGAAAGLRIIHHSQALQSFLR